MASKETPKDKLQETPQQVIIKEEECDCELCVEEDRLKQCTAKVKVV